MQIYNVGTNPGLALMKFELFDVARATGSRKSATWVQSSGERDKTVTQISSLVNFNIMEGTILVLVDKLVEHARWHLIKCQIVGINDNF